MREKGFATIFGLCLILVLALIIKGISAVEENHAYETMYFQAELELQDAANSGIYRAIEQVTSGAVVLSKIKNASIPKARIKNQYAFPVMTKKSGQLGTVTIETWGERLNIQPYSVNYTTNYANKDGTGKEAYVFFSRASADAKIMSGKIYRRAYAYVLVGDTTIHFLEAKMSPYKFSN